MLRSAANALGTSEWHSPGGITRSTIPTRRANRARCVGGAGSLRGWCRLFRGLRMPELEEGVELHAQHHDNAEQERPEHEQQERAEDGVGLKTLTEDGSVQREDFENDQEEDGRQS